MGNVMSFVDKDQLEPGSSVLMRHKNLSVIGILGDEVDPLVNVMKVDKAPLENYSDIGGLEADSGDEGGRGATADTPRALRGCRHQAPEGCDLVRRSRHGEDAAREGSC